MRYPTIGYKEIQGCNIYTHDSTYNCGLLRKYNLIKSKYNLCNVTIKLFSI